MTDISNSRGHLPFTHPLRPAKLPTGRPTAFDLTPDQSTCDAIAADLGLLGLRKLRLSGELRPLGQHDWEMTAVLGATVVQTCVVTLDPVTTRIDETVERRWLAHMPDPEPAEEVEMPEDDNAEQLTETIDLGQVMVESLALALPLYPRVEGAKVDTANFAEPGITPMTDEDVKPFAGLSDLRDKLAKGDKKS
ncbi:DUF177 domain-containing protein [Aliiroseovarius sediminis]|uniref:YceD family protein n=1 Tax=Aliiroseovarius sediminis TaxID=2925839 RepID=UPI001F55B9CE|nr:DUF177 domain-containing protein [Aliiroseovarius sediminis]MCI2393339.1 DUF177 domain-containing protein [Aliiroseovarius sediminis]